MDGPVLRAVPEGTPDPDRDRRFAERPFPLLEPVGWTGERRRGGCGVSEPGSATTALALIFGPQDPASAVPRLTVSVGDRFLIELRDADIWHLWLLSARLGKHVPGAEVQSGAFRPERVRQASVPIEGEPVRFHIFTVGHRWLAQGWWRGLAVELEGSGIQPTDLALQLAHVVPAGD